MVKLDVPLFVGVPEIKPLVALNVRPVGRLPWTIVQEYAGNPPVAAKVAL